MDGGKRQAGQVEGESIFALCNVALSQFWRPLSHFLFALCSLLLALYSLLSHEVQVQRREESQESDLRHCLVLVNFLNVLSSWLRCSRVSDAARDLFATSH